MRADRAIPLLIIAPLIGAAIPLSGFGTAAARPLTSQSSAVVCTASGTTDVIPGLKVCAQLQQAGTAASLIATTAPGTLCLGSVSYQSTNHRIPLTPDTNIVHAVGPSGRLIWSWSVTGFSSSAAAVVGTVICGDVSHQGGNTRTVHFTLSAPSTAPSATSPHSLSDKKKAPLKPSGVYGAYNCDPNNQYPDPAGAFSMCSEVLQRGNAITVLVSAPPLSWCVVSAIFSPPITPVALAPRGDALHQVGPSGFVKYSLQAGVYRHHGDHLIVAAQCAATRSGSYQLRNVDYQQGEMLPAARTQS